MELFYTPNTISVVVAIALEEAGIAYTPQLVDFASAEQTNAAYLAVNPKGRVPALVTPHGTLPETGAILDYIGSMAPDLIPHDPFQAGRMREVMYYIASTFHVAHAHKMRGSRWADQEDSFADMRAKIPQTVGACCAYLETKYPLKPFVLGSDFTLADPYLYVVSTWGAGDGVEMANYPKLTKFMETMRARPSVQAVIKKGMLT
jgi:glutathione S-transferase